MNKWKTVSGGIACPECSQIFNTADNETDRFMMCPHCGAHNADEVSYPKLKLVIREYHCMLKKFVVNGVKANVNDFGEGYDECPDDAPAYGCGYRVFRANGKPNHGVLEKYRLTMKDYRFICTRLEELLSVGRCSFCA